MTFDDYGELYRELKEIAKKYNIPMICEPQAPRPETYVVSCPPPKLVLIVDHLSVLKLRRR